MNSAVKSILIFASGAFVGSVSTYFAVKKYFEAKADLEISEVKSVYEEKVNEIEPHKSSINEELKGPDAIDIKEMVKTLNNKPDLNDYTKYFKEKGERIELTETIRDAKEAADKEGLSEEELAARELGQYADIDRAEMEGPQDDEPYSDEEDRMETMGAIDYQLNGESRKAIEEDRPPYVIDPSDYELTCSNYEKQALVWYHFDQVLADDNEEEVMDIRRLVGNCIEESGFSDDDVDTLYVRNDKIMCDFEISKIYEAFRHE